MKTCPHECIQKSKHACMFYFKNEKPTWIFLFKNQNLHAYFINKQMKTLLHILLLGYKYLIKIYGEYKK